MVEKIKAEPTLADVLAAVGAIGSRVDAIGARVDSMEKKDSEKEDEKKDEMPENLKKDSEKEDEKKDGETTPESSKEDSEKKDSEKEDEKKDGDGCAEKVAADAKKDAEEAKKDAAAAAAENAALKKRLAAVEAKLPQDRSDDDHRSMSASQARADSVYELFGKKAPRFLSGESNSEYRRRMIRDFVEHSATWKGVDVGALADSAFAVAEEQIYADAVAAAKDAVGVEDGGLRMVQGTTASGHKKVEFFGRPSAWMGRFAGSRRYATRISPNTKREAM